VLPEIMDPDMTQTGFRQHPLEDMTDVPLLERRTGARWEDPGRHVLPFFSHRSCWTARHSLKAVMSCADMSMRTDRATLGEVGIVEMVMRRIGLESPGRLYNYILMSQCSLAPDPGRRAVVQVA
jgi:hypothetical protein